MRNLLNFIIRYSTWFVFLFYVLLSLMLLFKSNPYQLSIYLTSANTVSTGIYGVQSDITGYFSLREINKRLLESNSQLENEVLNLREQIKVLKALEGDTIASTVPSGYERFDYVLASVVNNSTRHPRNYFTINAGADDGVQTGMGVVDQSGIVGIVNVTGRKTSRVISLLNVTQRFSVKIKGTDYVGSLSWKGEDPSVTYVEEIPRHVKFHIGDTIVTSGYSTTFPEGLPVGVVMGQVHTADDNFFTLKVRTASNFRRLGSVRVIKDFYKEELDSLATFDQKE